MKSASWLPETRRDFLREKLRDIRKCKKALSALHRGCAMRDTFDGTLDFANIVHRIDKALKDADKYIRKLTF